jgi:putative MATE family efflux protein
LKPPDNQPGQSTSKRVWQLAWPTIVSNLLFTTVGFTHIKIIAGLGTSAVAAVTTGHRIFFLVQAIMMGLSVASTALVARSWGAGNIEQAQRVAWNALAIAWALGGILTLPILLLPTQIAGFFGLEPQAAEQAARFIFWLGLFTVFSATNIILASTLRATGDVLTPLWFLAASSALNVSFSYLLAYGIGPLPALGVSGVGLGGGLAGAIVTLWFLLVWWTGRFNLGPPVLRAIHWPAIRQLVSIGSPAIVEQGVIQLAMLAFFMVIAGYGTTAYAAFGIGVTLVSFPIVIGFGFGIAAATLVGQQLGAGQPSLAILAGTRSLRMALAVMVLMSVLLASFAQELAGFMIQDPEAIGYTVFFIYMIALAQPFMAFEFALGGALRGAGDTRFPLLATFCGLIFGRLVPAWLFARAGLSVYWVLAVLVLDYLIKAGLLFHRFHTSAWLDIHSHPAGVDIVKKNT